MHTPDGTHSAEPVIDQPPLEFQSTALPPPESVPPREKPRVWPSLVVGLATLVAMITVSGIIGFFTLALAGGLDLKKPPTDETAFYDAAAKIVTHFWGIAVMVLPGQMTMLAVVFGAACLSPVPLLPRIGYVRGRVRWWALPLLLLGTIFTGVVGGAASSAIFTEPGRSLEMFVAMAKGPGDFEFAAAVILLSVVPGFVEESLFRGYIQRRLLQRWSPFAAIATSTLFFTVAHFDLQHMFAIVPLGAWLGYLAWRTGTLWPGMLCHATQNAVAMIGSRYGDPTDMSLTVNMIPMLVVTGFCLLGAILVLQRTRIPAQIA